jgi:hypothetical protein
VTAVARFIEAVVGAVAAPPGGWPDLVGLIACALATSIVALLVMKWTSDQRRLAAEKRQIQAGLFELRLFNGDLRTVLRSSLGLLRHTLTYGRLSLPPLLWLAAPLTLLLIQLEARYGYAGLVPGAPTVLSVRVAADAVRHSGGRPAFALRAPDGVRVEAGPIWAPSLREAAWRVVADREGDFALTVGVLGHEARKRLVAANRPEVRTPILARGPSAARLLAPGETPLPSDGVIESIEVDYPTNRITVAGFELSWPVPYFASCLLFALLLKRPLRVVL